MEDIFKTLQYSKEQKIKFATFRLRGPAQDWWQRIQADWESSQQEWTWEYFVEII
jgi:hypothetical protein